MQAPSEDSGRTGHETEGGDCPSLGMRLAMGACVRGVASLPSAPSAGKLLLPAPEVDVVFSRGVPDIAEAALEKLHPNIFASLAQIRLREDVRNVVTYMVRDKREPRAVLNLLLLKRVGREAIVLNEGIRLTGEQLGNFAEDVFHAWPNTSALTCHASLVDTSGLAWPGQSYVCSEDIVLALPASLEAYHASLGKSTRSYLNRYLGKLKRSFPGFAHHVMTGAEIDEQTMLELIAMNRKRMEGKGKTSILDDVATQRIIALARQYGMVSVISINGKVCAGTINYEIGGHYFLDVIAHDPHYNDCRVGTLGCYLTICECIARGGHEYHFLWGQSEYKYRLGGVQRDLMHATIFRSWRHMLAHPRIVSSNGLSSIKRYARLRLARDDKLARGARKLMQLLKS